MAIIETKATVQDLFRTDFKAELIGGRIVEVMPTGIRPNEVAGNIYVSLRAHTRKVKKGKPFTDNMGYIVPELASGRESFSPDASYYDGPLPANLMRFIEGPPSLAVEVRSESDYRAGAEAEMAVKRDDYFVAGTQVVWDVDTQADCIHVYKASDPK